MLTLNEAHLIDDALDSLSFADEIVVADLGSVDGSRELAERRGARAISLPNHPCATVNYNRCFLEARGDWIYLSAPDERPSFELADEIGRTVAAPVHDAYEMPRRNHIFGRWLKHGGNYPDIQLRLFRQGRGRFPEKHPDEIMDVQGNTGRLSGYIAHYAIPDLPYLLGKVNYYSKIYADLEIERGVVVSGRNALWYLIGKPATWFVYSYFGKFGCLDGIAGLVYAIMGTYSVFLRYALAWDKRRGAD